MAYQQGPQRGMQGAPQRGAPGMGQRPAGPPSGRMGMAQRPTGPPMGARPQAPMGGRPMGRRDPSVGQSLAAKVGGARESTQEDTPDDEFLMKLGLGALLDAYQRDSQSRSKVPGTNAPPMAGRMERFNQATAAPRYGAPPMGGGGMRPRPPMGGGMRPRPQMGGGMARRPMMRPQMQPQMRPQMMQPQMMQPQMMAPPPPPVAYGGFGSQPMPTGYYNPYMV